MLIELSLGVLHAWWIISKYGRPEGAPVGSTYRY